MFRLTLAKSSAGGVIARRHRAAAGRVAHTGETVQIAVSTLPPGVSALIRQRSDGVYSLLDVASAFLFLFKFWHFVSPSHLLRRSTSAEPRMPSVIHFIQF